MNEINQLEKDSLLYYQGGGRNIELSPGQQYLRAFYDVGNSYLVINALLMPGISNEEARLAEESKQVSLAVFECMEESMTVPGVTMRMISCSTMPLARAGSSICSQMATL